MDAQMTEPHYSGFWRRVAASIIDGIIIGAVTGVLTAGSKQASADLQSLLSLISAAIAFLYGVVMESSAKQATIGKLILGIQVTDLNGARVTFLRSLARNCCKILSTIILGLGYLFPIFTKRKQALHDMISGCLVIKNRVQF